MNSQTVRKSEVDRGRRERGIALILVLLSMLVLSVLAATIVFTARAETFASYNYRLDTEADYLAKAGIQRAINWFRSSHYQPVEESNPWTGSAILPPSCSSPACYPASYYYAAQDSGTPFYLFTSQYSGVQCATGAPCTAGSPIQLIGYNNGSGSTNFPTTIYNTQSTPVLVTTAFTTDFPSSGATISDSNGNTLGKFWINAQLLNYQTVNVGQSPPYAVNPVETWKITALAKWYGAGGSTVLAQAEEEAIVQPIFLPNWGNAMYGYCSVTMSGSAGTCTDAFNSSLGAYGGGNPSVASGSCDSASTNVIASGAGVGSNGYVSLGSNVTVSGNVTIGSSPTGGSSCCTPSSNPACGYNGNTSSVNGQVIDGPHINPPAIPTFPTNFPTGTPTISTADTVPDIAAAGDNPVWSTLSTSPWPFKVALSGAYPPTPASAYDCMSGSNCSTITGPNGTKGNPYLINSINISGSTQVNLVGGPSALSPVYYDIGCVSESGNAAIAVSGYVVLNVQGSGCGTTGLSIKGNGISNGISCTEPCTNTPPEAVVINYAGSNSVALGGNGAISAVVNAPNASVTLGGGGSSGYFVGSVQGNNVTDQGGYAVHYDIQLSRVSGNLGQTLVTAYGRKKM